MKNELQAGLWSNYNVVNCNNDRMINLVVNITGILVTLIDFSLIFYWYFVYLIFRVYIKALEYYYYLFPFKTVLVSSTKSNHFAFTLQLSTRFFRYRIVCR